MDQEKITDYLLSGTHPDGRSKVEFFRNFGLRLEEWKVLVEALRHPGTINSVISVVESDYGTRYSVVVG